MPLELSKVHHYVRQPGTMEVKLVRTNTYVRFSREGEGTVYLQHGSFWYEGGEQLTDIPSWLLDEIRKANPKVLKECGYESGEPRSVPKLDTSKSDVPRRTTVRRFNNG